MNSRRFCMLAILVILGRSFASNASKDPLKPVKDLGRKALDAFAEGQNDDGRRYFEEFFQTAMSTPGAMEDTRIELLLGGMGCAIPKHREMAKAALERAKNRAKDAEHRGIARDLLAGCTASSAPRISPSVGLDPLLASVNNEIPGVSGTTKGGYPWEKPVANIASLPSTPLDPSEIEKRLEEKKNPAAALAPTLARFGPRTQGTVTKYFIVATDYGGKTGAQGIAACLDRYRVDLGKEFGMVFPDYPITVYNTKLGYMIPTDARTLHRLNLPEGTLAYSVYADLSMVGVASPQQCGSLAHELTHLMIRGNFGDAPAWLEEGLASAVALSTPGVNQLIFHAGWRDYLLRSVIIGQRPGVRRPAVRQLLDYTWADFSPVDHAGLEQSAAIQAMASVFVRYLAAKNKLQSVYFAVRKQDLQADIEHYRTPQQIVEDQLGKNIDEVDQDFIAWFNQQPSVDRNGSIRTRASAPSNQ